MHLRKREKKLMYACVIFLGFCGLYALWLKPFSSRLKTLERVVPEKIALLDQLHMKNQQLLSLRENLDQLNQNLAAQPEEFDLLSLLENIAQKNQLNIYNVQSNTTDIFTPSDQTYSETLITIELREIILQQLVGFLASIPTEKPYIRIKNLEIKKTPGAKWLESNMIISHLQLKTNPL